MRSFYKSLVRRIHLGNLETRLLLRIRLLKPASQCTSRYIASPSKADLTGVPSLLSRTARSRLRELASSSGFPTFPN